VPQETASGGDEDRAQRCIFVADGANTQVATVDRRPSGPHGRQFQVGAQHGDRFKGTINTAEGRGRPARAQVQAAELTRGTHLRGPNPACCAKLH